MATASVPNPFVNSTPADASEVNANFTALVSFVNNSTVHRDGSKAMASAFDAGTHKILRVGSGTEDSDAVNKGQLDAATTNTVRSTEIYSARKTSGDSTISSTTSVNPTWITDTLIEIPSATYDRHLHLSATVGTMLSSGAETTGRTLRVYPSIKVNDGNYTSDVFPSVVHATSGLASSEPAHVSTVVREMVIPSGEAWDIRLAGSKSSSSFGAVVLESDTQLSALVVPVVPVVIGS